MKTLLYFSVFIVSLSVSSCKKCGHCAYDNGTKDETYCSNGENYNPNIYKSYKANCEFRTNSRWVEE